MTATVLTRTGEMQLGIPRHRWMSQWCKLLDDLTLAEIADQFDEAALSGDGCLVRLPSFCWREALDAVDRTDLATGAKNPLVPIRLNWNRPQLMFLADGHSLTLEWSAQGLGVDESGTVRLECRPGFGDAAGIAAVQESDSLFEITAVGAQELRSGLQQLVDAGRQAKVKALFMLEDSVERKVYKTHSFLIKDVQLTLSDQPGLCLVDEQTLETYIQRFVLGDDDGKETKAEKLIKLCLDPDAFRNVDPLKFCSAWLHGEIQNNIREMIDDPQAGSRIRRVARSLGVTGATTGEVNDVVAACREQYPNEHIGTKRVKAALTIHPFTISPLDDGDATPKRRLR